MTSPQISIVSPVYKCENCLELLVERVRAAISPSSYEIIFVDDASPDNSWSRIQQLADSGHPVKGIRLARNFGQHAAISAGLEAARGRAVVVMDCDLQDRPEEIPKLLAALDNGAQIALAQRIDRQDNKRKKLSSWLFFKVLSWLTGSEHDHRTANFGAYSRLAINTYLRLTEKERVFPLLIRWTGLSVTLVPVQHDERSIGSSSYSLRKLLRLSFHIALSFSDKPLRFVVTVAVFFSLLSLVLVTISIGRFLAGDIQVAGFTSIIASIWFVGSSLLASVGVIGLYVGRIFNEVKHRPSYIIEEYTLDKP